MTSKDIADRLATTRGISRAEAREMVASVLDAISAGVAKGEVSLAGFGKFTTSRLAARPGRNPRSGETIIINPSSRVTFRAAKGLKDRVSGK